MTVKSWKEKEKDAFIYFHWFNKDEALERVGMIPDLSVVSVNASELFDINEKNIFIELCDREIQEILKKEDILKKYSLYLFVSVEVKDKKSRTERYKKVWKKLQSQWQLDGFNKGPEIEREIKERMFFQSVAEFKVDNLLTALQIVASNPQNCAIIASKKADILSEKTIKKISKAAFNIYRNRIYEIDYFGLAIHFCSEGDLIFRWGSSAEEAEIDMVFNSDMFILFDS